MTFAYNSAAPVANYFLDAAKKDSSVITTMKLLKLTYIAYGWVIAVLNVKLFEEEIEAWKYGPVIPSIYHEFKHFGSAPIEDSYAQEYDPFEDFVARIPKVSNKNEADIAEVLELVWGIYGDKSATELMRMTHKKDTPWDKVWNQDKKRHSGVIDPDVIKDYYRKVIKELTQDAA